MKNLITLLFLLCSANAFCSDVSIDATAQIAPRKDGYCEVTLAIDIVNGSKQNVGFRKWNGGLIDCEIELWFQNRGIKLRPQKDAQWRRDHVFISWDNQEIKAGETCRLTFKLKDLLPSHSDDDDFARALVKKIEEYGRGKGRVTMDLSKYEGNHPWEATHISVQSDFEIKERKTESANNGKIPIKFLFVEAGSNGHELDFSWIANKKPLPGTPAQQ